MTHLNQLTRNNKKWVAAFIMTAITCLPMYSIGQETTESILQSFAESYKSDAMALTATFGIKVGDDWWYVESTRTPGRI